MVKNGTKRETPASAPVGKFGDLARHLETDDDETRIDERLKKPAKPSPKPKGTD